MGASKGKPSATVALCVLLALSSYSERDQCPALNNGVGVGASGIFAAEKDKVSPSRRHLLFTPSTLF